MRADPLDQIASVPRTTARVLPVAPSCDGEGEEVGVEQLRSRPIDVVTNEEVADDLAGPRDLTQARAAPARVRKGQVQQLQGAIEGRVEAPLVAFLPGPDRPADIGPRIAELLRERPPAAARQG